MVGGTNTPPPGPDVHAPAARRAPSTCPADYRPDVDISIVIASWNTRDLLRSCLSSLDQNVQSVQIETVVVDNASRDGSAEMVARDFPWVRLLGNERNRGFAAASNQGICAARGRYILLLNSDTVVLPGAFEAMVRYMDTHPGVGAMGPRLLNEDLSLQSSARDFPRLVTDAMAILEMERWPLMRRLSRRYMRRALLYWSDHLRTREVDWVMGACLMLRREALEQSGPLDAGYFFFGEEMDLCYRLRQLGWAVAFLADAEIIHLGGQSAARIPAARLKWHFRALCRFYDVHRGIAQRVVLRAIIALNAVARMVWLVFRHRGSADARAILAAYAHVLARTVRW